MAMFRLNTSETLTIANAATTSGACTAKGYAAFGLITPAALTSTSITFTVCDTLAGTYVPLYDSTGSTQVSVTVTTSRGYDLPAELASWPYFKLVGGSSEGGARSLVVVKKA